MVKVGLLVAAECNFIGIKYIETKWNSLSLHRFQLLFSSYLAI
jgi:hypothetical protein